MARTLTKTPPQNVHYTYIMKSTKVQTLGAIGAHVPCLYCQVPHTCQVCAFGHTLRHDTIFSNQAVAKYSLNDVIRMKLQVNIRYRSATS